VLFNRVIAIKNKGSPAKDIPHKFKRPFANQKEEKTLMAQTSRERLNIIEELE